MDNQKHCPPVAYGNLERRREQWRQDWAQAKEELTQSWQELKQALRLDPAKLTLEQRQQLEALKAQQARLKAQWLGLRSTMTTSPRISAEQAAGLALLPLTLILGLPLAVGTLWGLWQALADLLQ